MNTCETCAHFSEAPPSMQPGEDENGWGACELSIKNSKSYVVHYVARDTEMPEGANFIPMAMDGILAALAVNRQFGCNQYESKVKEVAA